VRAAPRPEPVLPASVRAQATAAYRALRAGSEGLFRDAWGQLVWGVPRGVVRAYVLARYHGHDPRPAVAAAHFGQMDLGPGGQAVVAAYVGRLQQLERGGG
jgi:hypothetical protein